MPGSEGFVRSPKRHVAVVGGPRRTRRPGPKATRRWPTYTDGSGWPVNAAQVPAHSARAHEAADLEVLAVPAACPMRR